MLERINVPPALLVEQSKLVIPDLAIAVRVHVPVQLLDVSEADLEPEEINGLRELIDGDRLRMVRVDISKGFSQVAEPLIDFE